MFFAMIKKAVADQYLPSQAGTEKQPQPEPKYSDFIQHCIDAARRNICLGRWIHSISPRNKFLHQEAHAIFNAALVMLLHKLAFPEAEAQDFKDIAFAIDVFKEEATLENRFAMDCSSVLTDLLYFVEALPNGPQAVLAGSSFSKDGNLSSQDEVRMLENHMLDASSSSQFTTLQNNALQTELEAWLNDDYLDLYNDFLL